MDISFKLKSPGYLVIERGALCLDAVHRLFIFGDETPRDASGKPSFSSSMTVPDIDW
jgi:hypothetical protein